MFFSYVKGAIEALLFVAGEPVQLKKIADAVEIDEENAELLLNQLMNEWSGSEHGLQIVEVAGGYQLCTKPEVASYLEKFCQPQQVALSKAAMETLAIIAFRQPITRAEVEEIRGVKIDSALRTLVERGLIKEVGRREGLGRAIIYGTSPDFLKCFGLKTLADLPLVVEQFTQQEGDSELKISEDPLFTDDDQRDGSHT